MLDYEHDIFVSYRRIDEDWMRWTHQNFIRPLRALLRPGLGNVKIFVDNKIETGARWPAHLARALARSRLLIPVLCRDYFNSNWCRLELALMHHRERLVNDSNPANAQVLILPVVIDDGNSFPPEVQVMQSESIHEYALPFMSVEGRLQEEFTARLKQWCPRIEEALQTIPPYNPAWEEFALEQFEAMFEMEMGVQRTVPGLSLLTGSHQGRYP